MFKLKIFLKISTKKLKKLFVFKNKTLNTFIKYLLIENNRNYNNILKELIVLLKLLNKKKIFRFKWEDNLIISLITSSPAKKIKRFRYKAKGKITTIEKRNSFLTIGLVKKKKELYSTNFVKKNYLFI